MPHAPFELGSLGKNTKVKIRGKLSSGGYHNLIYLTSCVSDSKPQAWVGDVRDYVSGGKGVLPVVMQEPRTGAPRCHSEQRRLRVYRWPLRSRLCENSGGGGDGGLDHHYLRRSHAIWRFGAGSPVEGAPGLGGSMCGARFWPVSRLTPSRRRSRREHLPARSRGGYCKPAP